MLTGDDEIFDETIGASALNNEDLVQDFTRVKLDNEGKTLEEVWLKIAELKLRAEAEINEINSQSEYDFVHHETLIGINVGGHLFETTAGILTRDPNSILAALCRKDAILPIMTRSRTFYFDRDWWIFRHVMNYLRSGTLPNELETLKELYTEASYFRLETLQQSIEDVPLERVISNAAPDIYLTWPTINVNRLKSTW
eukprot:gene1174-2286_t